MAIDRDMSLPIVVGSLLKGDFKNLIPCIMAFSCVNNIINRRGRPLIPRSKKAACEHGSPRLSSKIPNSYLGRMSPHLARKGREEKGLDE